MEEKAVPTVRKENMAHFEQGRSDSKPVVENRFFNDRPEVEGRHATGSRPHRVKPYQSGPYTINRPRGMFRQNFPANTPLEAYREYSQFPPLPGWGMPTHFPPYAIPPWEGGYQAGPDYRGWPPMNLLHPSQRGRNEFPPIPRGLPLGSNLDMGGGQFDMSEPPPFDINERGRERLHNDYNQHFVDTGERPQNFIRDAEDSKRFEEYPKLEKLMLQKRDVVQKRATPAQHIHADLRMFDLSSLGTKFDVILVDPPWFEYYDRVVGGFCPTEDLTAWTLEEMMKIRVDSITDTPSFCFLWCGVTHLEHGRMLLSKWGFRRCEDICWLKTNKISSRNRHIEKGFRSANVIHNENSYLQRTKEHCLMGIRGTVRRSQDTHFIHANLDTDIIVDEEPEDPGCTIKPIELYDVIERFCLGRRRLELFGTDRNIRKGWLTIGKSVSFTNFEAKKYSSWFEGDTAWPECQDHIGGRYTGSTTEIESLRPKSPSRTTKAEDASTD
ncbi:putative N6-adenosine-methyltransferase [Cardiosporidium cionae]|uniref:N6-adenosine-methyltransferase n=1 Tax=Cardiosporidium cionae TaxID=476202 RepID=A0ABQ7JFQ9_9APIC|nr:putative N6-adenosine-methyltransferase [Cardiosporidium cionae]|eukprot:KAF8822846.1 putative N6-adenosine-methyltransferase [Cardiosporidium cionae]